MIMPLVIRRVEITDPVVQDDKEVFDADEEWVAEEGPLEARVLNEARKIQMIKSKKENQIVRWAQITPQRQVVVISLI